LTATNFISEKIRLTAALGRGLAVGLCLVAVAGLAPPLARALTLQEAVKLAIDTHPTVLGAKKGQAIALEEIDQARAGYFPSVDSRAAAGLDQVNNQTTRFRRSRGDGLGASLRSFHQDGSVTVQQMLFDGFETRNLVSAARSRLSSADHLVVDAEEAIALRAIEAFLEVQRSRDILELAEENVEVHIEVTEDVAVRAETGAGSLADLFQAESRLALAQDRLIEQRGQLREAEADFLEAVGVLPDELIVDEAPGDALPESVYDAIVQALDANPALQAASANIDSRRHDAEALEGLFVPRFDLEINASQENNVNGVRNSGNSVSALLVMRFNWYRGGGDTARLKGARELVSRTIQEEHETRRLIEEQVRVDWNRLITAEDRLPHQEERVVNASQVVSAYRQQFELGRRTLLDVLDTENELFQARAELAEGEYDVIFAHWALLATLGQVLGTLELASEAAWEPDFRDPKAEFLLLDD
jgi:adhesin transport system outer membrane protein